MKRRQWVALVGAGASAGPIPEARAGQSKVPLRLDHGISEATRGPADLRLPPDTPAGETWR